MGDTAIIDNGRGMSLQRGLHVQRPGGFTALWEWLAMSMLGIFLNIFNILILRVHSSFLFPIVTSQFLFIHSTGIYWPLAVCWTVISALRKV